MDFSSDKMANGKTVSVVRISMVMDAITLIQVCSIQFNTEGRGIFKSNLLPFFFCKYCKESFLCYLLQIDSRELAIL